MATGIQDYRKHANALVTIGVLIAVVGFLQTVWDPTKSADDIDGLTDLTARSKNDIKSMMNRQHTDSGNKCPDEEVIQMVLVICGNRISEARVNLKSAAMLARANIQLHVFIEDQLKEPLMKELNSWPNEYMMKITVTFHSISYPSHVSKEFISLYRPCSSQRIFFPDLLPEVDAIMYVDTDVLFMRPLDDYWGLLKEFNSTQLASMVPASDEGCPNPVYRKGVTKCPFYGDFGLNSGVMLMNLTRMRSIGIVDRLMDVYNEYEAVIELPDQDMYNIFFNYNPERLHVASCKWNWRKYSCAYIPDVNLCRDGIAIIHGTEQIFHTDEIPAFKAVYEAFENFTLGTDIEKGLIDEILKRLSHPSVASHSCTQIVSSELVSTLRLSSTDDSPSGNLCSSNTDTTQK